eukprot:m.118773 g.118773  ORF g.118773 m.118773 type:complete len:90 (+) comp17223_c0_seq5:48-317(+)
MWALRAFLYCSLFHIMKDFHDPIVERLESFLRANEIEVAGIEFIRDASGSTHVYDINTNTNYNPAAEKQAGVSAVPRLAEYLRDALDKA